MSRRRRSTAVNKPLPAEAPTMRGRLALCLVAVAVVGTSAAIAYLWPPSSSDPSVPAESHSTIELPTEPESIAVDELRAEAQRGAAELTDRFPQSAAAHRTAATLYQFLKQYDLATRHWEECLMLDARLVPARVSLAKVHLLVGRDREARDVLKAALDEGTRTPDLYEQLAEALSRTGELDEAERVAQAGAQEFPNHAGLWITGAQVQLQRNRLNEAKTSIDASLAIEPSSSKALFLAANICTRLGESSQADAHRRRLEQLRSAAARDRLPFEEEYSRSLRSVVAMLFTAMALEYQEQGDFAQAMHWCRRAIALDPKSGEPYRLLVDLCRGSDQLANAMVVQRRLMELEPASAVNYINFASLAVALGRLEEGEAALVTAARMAPQNALVRRTLATVHLARRELKQARAAAEKAVELEPSPDNYRLLADVCLEQGDAPAADSAMQAAQRLQAVAP